MKFKLFSVEIYVSFLFAAVMVFMLATDRTGLVIPTFFAVTVHEVGHLIAMWAAGCAPKSIRLIPASVQIIRPFSVSDSRETAILLCGPAANIAVFLALYLNCLIFENEYVLIFALLNLIIAVFNLMPVAGLDGGRLVFIALSRFIDAVRAQRIVKLITAFISFLSFTAGIYLILNGRVNISVFIVAIYFFISSVIKL